VRKYFDLGEKYSEDAWREALSEKILVEKSHDEIEIKARDLLKASNLKRFGGEGSPHYLLAGEILHNVQRCRGVSFGVLVNPDHPDDVKCCANGCPPACIRLIEVVGR